MHGFLGSRQDWDEIVAKLNHHYYCITVDLPGHGDSTHTGQLADAWTFNDLSQKLAALLAHLKISAVTPVGYSMGGRIALYFALKHPQLISRLILESTSPGIKRVGERDARFQNDLKIAQKLRTDSIENFLNFWYGLPLFSGIKNLAGYNTLLERRKKNDPKLLAKALESFSSGIQPYLMNKLATLKMPVYLICGERDHKYLSLMKHVKQKYPHFNLKLLTECGHNVHFEKANQFAEHMLQVLSL